MSERNLAREARALPLVNQMQARIEAETETVRQGEDIVEPSQAFQSVLFRLMTEGPKAPTVFSLIAIARAYLVGEVGRWSDEDLTAAEAEYASTGGVSQESWVKYINNSNGFSDDPGQDDDDGPQDGSIASLIAALGLCGQLTSDDDEEPVSSDDYADSRPDFDLDDAPNSSFDRA